MKNWKHEIVKLAMQRVMESEKQLEKEKYNIAKESAFLASAILNNSDDDTIEQTMEMLQGCFTDYHEFKEQLRKDQAALGEINSKQFIERGEYFDDHWSLQNEE